jgi:hypothetical protein
MPTLTTAQDQTLKAIWSGADGEKWKKTGIQIYGWINGGFNVSTSTNGHYANAPAAYFIVPNSFQPDQQTLYIEPSPTPCRPTTSTGASA